MEVYANYLYGNIHHNESASIQIMNDFMFDTMVFNRIVDGSFYLGQLHADLHIYCTHVQQDELNATPDVNRREHLATVFAGFMVIGRELPTETMVWGITRWGKGKWGAKDCLYSSIKSQLDSIKKKKNNPQDALILETAIANNLCLVTDDRTLINVAQTLGAAAISVTDFKKTVLKQV